VGFAGSEDGAVVVGVFLGHEEAEAEIEIALEFFAFAVAVEAMGFKNGADVVFESEFGAADRKSVRDEEREQQENGMETARGHWWDWSKNLAPRQ
jgi:hypothetical protein